MPIYAYKCESCGFAKDVLQKISDAPLTQCPSCAQPAFRKQVTAAGFQLKGSGWYVTDFRGGSSTGATAPSGTSDAGGDKAAAASSDASTAGSGSTTADSPSKPAAPTAAD